MTVFSASRMPGLFRISGRRLGSKETVPPFALIDRMAAQDARDHARRVERCSHHVQVAAFLDEARGIAGKFDDAAGAVADVEDEGAAAVLAITHESAAGGALRIDLDAGRVDIVGLEAIEIDIAEIVVADARDDRAVLAEFANLIDEDGGRAGGEGADQRDGGPEAVATLGRDDLDQDFPDRQYFFQCVFAPESYFLDCFARTSSQTAMRMTRPLTMSW